MNKNIKKDTKPNIYLLIDPLITFLAMFIILTKSVISIDPPKNELFKGGKIVYTDSSDGVMRYSKDTKWRVRDDGFGIGEYILFPCKYKYCNDYQTPHNEPKYIAINGELLEKIALAYFISCSKDTEACQEISYPITLDGVLNYEKLYSKYDMFNGIDGI